MGNRKENLKTTLGITQYPWSSDDEDNPRTNQEPTPASRRYLDSDTPHVPGPSGADASSSTVSPTRRNPTRLEQDLYWLHNNPNIINVPVPPSRSQDPEIMPTFARFPPTLNDIFWPEPGEENSQNNQESSSAGRRRYHGTDTNQQTAAGASTSASSPTRRNPTQPPQPYWPENDVNSDSDPSRSRSTPKTSDLLLMQAINRLTRTGHFCRHPQIVSSRRGGASHNVMFNPAMQTNVTAALGTSRIRRRPSHRAPLPSIRTSIVHPVMDEERSSSPSAARTSHSQQQNTEREQNSDDDLDSYRPLTLVVEESDENNDDNNEETNDENNEPEQENMDMDTSEGVVQSEEDGGEENREAEDNDNGNDAEVMPETEETAEEPPATSPSSPVPQTSQPVKRRRESPENAEPETVKDFNQCLLSLLECPVCLEWMEPPMSQCRRGHLVCGRCRARLSACPVCRTAFSSVRNRAMEAVAELIRYPCRHECGRDTQLRRRAAHEASCAARRYRCPAPPCAERNPLPLPELAEHFQTEHLSMLKLGRKHKFSIRVNTKRHDNWFVMVARELFHLRVDVDLRAWGVVVYVAYIGPKCNSNQFVYEVTVTGAHNNRKLVYTRATHSDLESSSLNVSRQDCFHLPLDQAHNFLRLKKIKHSYRQFDKFLDIMVEINKREEPIESATEEPDS